MDNKKLFNLKSMIKKIRIKETIVALATSFTHNSTLAIIRVSGENCYEIVKKCFQSKKDIFLAKPNTIVVGNLIIPKTKEKIDEVVLLLFRNPKSFTGEDLIEINCHGNIFLIKKIISTLLSAGAVLAHRGEFTKRAFFNKKITLPQAEAINELIKTDNELFSELIVENLDEKQTEKIVFLKNKIIKIFSQIEVEILYPEWNDLEKLTIKRLIPKFNEILEDLEYLTKNNFRLNEVRQGINISIIGKPNSGKSTLLNKILNEDKAIVPALAGTTHDIIEGKLIFEFLKFNLFDTAGIRKTNNMLEKLAIQKTVDNFKRANLLFWIIDGSKDFESDDYLLFKKLKTNKIQFNKIIFLINKIDLKVRLTKNQLRIKLNDFGIKSAKIIEISALEGKIEELFNFLKQKFLKKLFNLKENFFLLNTRQCLLFEKVIEIVKRIRKNLKETLLQKTSWTLDLLSLELNEIISIIDTVLGKKQDFNVYEEIFSNFCLGK